MEELQSTEVLDREILEDARKKALRALKTCEDTINENNAKWESKINDDIASLDIKYDSLIKAETQRVMARLPIDKQRVKIEKTENVLKSAVKTWYNNLSRAQVCEILSNEISKCTAVCKDDINRGKIDVAYNKLEKNEAASILKSLNISNFSLSSPDSPQTAGLYPSITIETEICKITASMEKITDFLLYEKREELTCALVGGDFMRSS